MVCSGCGWSSKSEEKRSKFGNRKVELDGYTFDSGAEARRYAQLKLMQQAGEVRELRVHPKYRLNLGAGKLRYYEVDFDYVDYALGEIVVEDVKSKPTITPMYRLKRAAMLEQYGIRIREVM